MDMSRYELTQLDAFLEIVRPFATVDMYDRQALLYNSFVALCADTDVKYESYNWNDAPASEWEEHIWGVIQDKFIALQRPAPWSSDWETEFQTSLTGLNTYIAAYNTWLKQHYPGATDRSPVVVMQQTMLQAARQNMASAFYNLLVLTFHVPRRQPITSDGHTTVFCPENTPWQVPRYNNDRLRLNYQNDKKIKALLKHAAWLFWCGDDLHTGHTHRIRVDERIIPMLSEYNALRLSLQSREGNPPVFEDLPAPPHQAHISLLLRQLRQLCV